MVYCIIAVTYMVSITAIYNYIGNLVAFVYGEIGKHIFPINNESERV